MSQVIRKYLKPMPHDPEIEKGKLKKGSSTYRAKLHTKECIFCSNQATKLLCFEYEGYTKVEKYCDIHASEVEV